MWAMWKIATVMLTTTVFAGLLIANPPRLSSAASDRPITVATPTVPTVSTPANSEHRSVRTSSRTKVPLHRLRTLG